MSRDFGIAPILVVACVLTSCSGVPGATVTVTVSAAPVTMPTPTLVTTEPSTASREASQAATDQRTSTPASSASPTAPPSPTAASTAPTPSPTPDVLRVSDSFWATWILEDFDSIDRPRCKALADYYDLVIRNAEGDIAAVADEGRAKQETFSKSYGVWYLNCKIPYRATIRPSAAFEFQIVDSDGAIADKSIVSSKRLGAGKYPILSAELCTTVPPIC